jgi:hypothetical protein
MFRLQNVILRSAGSLSTLVQLLKVFKHYCTYITKPYTVLSKKSFMQFKDLKMFQIQGNIFLNYDFFLLIIVI